MKFKKIIALLLISTTLINCSGNASKEEMGTFGGAAGGALLGSFFGSGAGKVGAIAAGALIGGFIGNRVGANMDEQDKELHRKAAQQALENAKSGQSVSWNNPDNGHSGTFEPVKTYKKSSGEYCREYTQTVTVAGKTQQAYGTACRQPDGNWKVVN
jgi:surface antigen